MAHHWQDAVQGEEGGEEQWVYPHTAEDIDKRRNTIWKSVRSRPIPEACMGAERREGTPRRLNWWHQTMDYSGKGKGGGVYGGLRWLSAPRPLAARPPAPSRLPPAGAPLAAAVAGSAAGHGGTGALDTLWRAAHFYN